MDTQIKTRAKKREWTEEQNAELEWLAREYQHHFSMMVDHVKSHPSTIENPEQQVFRRQVVRLAKFRRENGVPLGGFNNPRSKDPFLNEALPLPQKILDHSASTHSTDPGKPNENFVVVDKFAQKWTPEVDAMLIQAYDKHGNLWAYIRDHYPLLAPYYHSSYANRLVTLQRNCYNQKTEIPRCLQYAIPGHQKAFDALVSAPFKNKSLVSVLPLDPLQASSEKEETMETVTARFQPDNRGIFKCPDCFETHSEYDLWNDGLHCACGITPEKFAVIFANFHSVTYVFSDNANPSGEWTKNIVYVGTTTDLQKRLGTHKAKFDFSRYVVRVSVRISERSAILILKPLNNFAVSRCAPTSYICRFIDRHGEITQRDERDFQYVYKDALMDPNQDKEYNIPKHDSMICYGGLEVAGIGYTFFDMFKCYIERVDTCQCTFQFAEGVRRMPCVVRSHINNLWNYCHKDQPEIPDRPKYYPLSENQVDIAKFKPDRRFDNIDKTIGYPATFTEESFRQVVSRNQDVTEKTRENYRTAMTTLWNMGFKELYMQPTLLNKRIMENMNFCNVEGILTVINILFGNLTMDELVNLFGNHWRQIRNRNFVNAIQHRRTLAKAKNDQTKTEKELDLWVEFDELVAAYQRARLDVFGNGQVSRYTLQSYIAFMLQLMQDPLRNVYYSLKLFDWNPASDNYIDIDKQIMVFNDHKTAKYFGRFTCKIKEDVWEDLKVLVNHCRVTNSNHLFLNTLGNPMSSRDFSVMLQSVVNKYVGKRLGSQMIRKIFITHYRSQDNFKWIDSKNLSRRLMHSETTSRRIYHKFAKE